MNPALDFHYHYESVMRDMSKWIQAITWGGHEKDCPMFAAGAPGNAATCTCIRSVLDRMYRTIRQHDIAVLHATAADASDSDEVIDLRLRLDLANQEKMSLRAENDHLRWDIRRLQCGGMPQ